MNTNVPTNSNNHHVHVKRSTNTSTNIHTTANTNANTDANATNNVSINIPTDIDWHILISSSQILILI